METELKWFNDEGLEYLLQKNEAEIEAIKAVNAAIMEEMERRNNMIDKCHEAFYMDPPKEEDLRRFREQQKKEQKLTKEYILYHLGVALADIRQREGEFSYCGDVIEDTIRYLEEEEK